MTDPVLILKEKVRILEAEVKILKDNNRNDEVIQTLKSELNEAKTMINVLNQMVKTLTNDKEVKEEPKKEESKTELEQPKKEKQQRNGKNI
jgi:folylpolyglutamate synthase/dihydropteroate synthase